MDFPKSLVIIPTYNEKENITLIITEVLSQNSCLEVLVVDDNSPDGTGAIVQDLVNENAKVHLLTRQEKLGLGSAYVLGFEWALARDYQRIFEMDADFSHSPKDLIRFLEKAETHDLVLGSRYLDSKISVINWDMKRLILSYAANMYTRIVTRMPVRDTTGGIKCFRLEA